MAKPLLIILAGLPGSGKTYLAVALAKSLPAAHVSSDEIRFYLFNPLEYTRKAHEQVFDLFHQHISEWLNSGQNVIADATNLSWKNVAPLLNLAMETGAEIHSFMIYCPSAIRDKRLKAREEDAEGVIKASRKMEKYANFEADTTLDGTLPAEELVRCVRNVVYSDHG